MLNSEQKDQNTEGTVDSRQKEQDIVKEGHTLVVRQISKIIISFHRSVAYQGTSLSQPKHLPRYINADLKDP